MNYFKDMKQSSYEVDNVIEELIHDRKYTQFNLNTIFEKRKGATKMRPYLTQIAYEYCGGAGNSSSLNALSEINNLHLYLDNWIFDNKYGVWDFETKKQVISEITINSQIYEKLTGDLISKLGLSPEIELLIRKKFDDQIISCYKGQSLDLETNLETRTKFKTDEEFLLFYFDRCALLSGEAYGLSAWLGGIVMDAPIDALDKLYQFGKRLGVGIHISNDLGDFGLFNTNATLKSYQDQMADLINSRLTLPIYYVLKYGTIEQKTFFLEKSGTQMTDLEKTIALEILIDSGSFNYCNTLIRNHYKETKKYVHDNFCKCVARDKLSSMVSTIKTNKYLGAIRSVADKKFK